MDKQEYILVPKVWFEELLKEAKSAESVLNNIEDEDETAFNLVVKMSILIGYCKSAQTILNHNEKVEK